jgi:hypothetical protein
MADLTPTKPGYYWAQWRKAVLGTRNAAELTPSDDWEPVQVFENALDDQHPEYLMVEVGGVERAQGLDCFIWGDSISQQAEAAPVSHQHDPWERIAFNLCVEFGSDFVEDKQDFAKAVVREYLAAAPSANAQRRWA